MTQDRQKKAAAEAALDYIQPGMLIGVGSGTTVNYFIEALASIKGKLEGTVASSLETAQRLKALSIPIYDLNTVSEIPLYIDGTDEVNSAKQLIKGGGGALTREKVIAAVADKFICIADQSKKVDLLGNFPLPIEVIPMARSYVARQLVQLGGDPVYRQGFITDNGNVIIDVYNLKMLNPIELEQKINNIVGVVTNGLFAMRPANIVLLATEDGVLRS